MTFLNGILVFGAAAFVIPLVIHIINRSRFNIQPWGAMHLLESVLRVNRRRVQLEQIILLIIRCAIPILLALCLAQMVVTQQSTFLNLIVLPLVALGFLVLVALFPSFKKLFWSLCAACLLYALAAETGVIPSSDEDKSSSSKDLPASTVILLDDSFSMRVEGSFDVAREFSSGFLKQMKKGSQASVVRMGGAVAPIFDTPTRETEYLAKKSSELNATSDSIDVFQSIDKANDIVMEGENVKREIILVSDFRKADWEKVSESLTKLKESLQDQTLKPVLTLIDVGRESQGNLSVETIQVEPSLVGVGQEVKVRANVLNRNEDESSVFQDYEVRLLVNDKEVQRKKKSTDKLNPLVSGKLEEVSFNYKFEQAGSSVVTVELIPNGVNLDNALIFDDRKSVEVSALDRLGVLLVNGEPSDEFLEGETDFLKLALTPFKETDPKEPLQTKDFIDATEVELSTFDPSLHLQNQSVVVLANVKSLNDNQVDALGAFVRNGGGLWVCLGDQVDADWYNETLGSEQNGLLPLPLSNEIKGSETDDTKHTLIVASNFDHPALAIFNDKRNGNLADADIMKWHLLDETDTHRARAATVVARLETDAPWLVEKKMGKGVIIQMATSIDEEWTMMPTKNFYLPLVREITNYVIEQVNPKRNLPAGATLIHYLPGTQAESSITVTLPDNSSYEVKTAPFGSQAVVEFSNTRMPGTYVMSGKEMEPVKFVVNASAEESRLERISEEEIREKTDAILGFETYYVDASAKKSSSGYEEKDSALGKYLEMDNERSFLGERMWLYLLAAILALVILELILQRIFGRVKA